MTTTSRCLRLYYHHHHQSSQKSTISATTTAAAIKTGNISQQPLPLPAFSTLALSPFNYYKTSDDEEEEDTEDDGGSSTTTIIRQGVVSDTQSTSQHQPQILTIETNRRWYPNDNNNHLRNNNSSISSNLGRSHYHLGGNSLNEIRLSFCTSPLQQNSSSSSVCYFSVDSSPSSSSHQSKSQRAELPSSSSSPSVSKKVVRIETPDGTSLDAYITSTTTAINDEKGDKEIASTKTQYPIDNDEHHYPTQQQTQSQSQIQIQQQLQKDEIASTILSNLSPSNLSFLTLNELESTVQKIEQHNGLHVPPQYHLQHQQPYENERNILQRIMRACAQFGVRKGADLAERILAVALLQAKRNGSGGGEGPTREMYTVAMDAWVKSQSQSQSQRKSGSGSGGGGRDQQRWKGGSTTQVEKDDLDAAQRVQQILEFMWEEYDASVAAAAATTSSSNISDSETSSRIAVKPDVIHYTIVLQGLARTNSRDAVHRAQSLVLDAERLSGIRDIVKDSKRTNATTALSSQYGGKSSSSLLSSLSSSTSIPLDVNLVPDRTCYNTLLYAYSRYSQSPPPHTTHNNNVNNNRTNNNNKHHKKQQRFMTPTQVMERMRQIVQKMEDVASVLADDEWIPNARSYNPLLVCCSGSSSIRGVGGEEAERIFVQLLDRHRMNQKKHYYCGTTAMSTLSTYEYNGEDDDGGGAGNRESVHAEFPNISSYNAVLNAWSNTTNSNSKSSNSSNSDRHRGAIRAEAILCALLKRNDTDIPPPRNDRLMKPLPIITTTAQDRSNGISSSSSTTTPDIVTFNSVINAWAKSGASDAGERAEAILNYLTSYDDDDDRQRQRSASDDDINNNDSEFNEIVRQQQKSKIKPDVITYSSVINAWSRCNNPQRAERVLDRLLHEYYHHQSTVSSNSNEPYNDDDDMDYVDEDKFKFVPNTILFSTTIHSWAKSDENNRGERAEALLDRMQGLFEESGGVLRPSALCYSHVIAAWESCASDDSGSISGDVTCGDKAESILTRMKEEGGYFPDTAVYNSVFSAIGKSPIIDINDDNDDGASFFKARTLLTTMINDSNENNSAAKPDVFSFNHVIKSYLKCAIGGGGDATTTAPRVVAKGLRKKALFAAIDTFNALCQFSTAQPNEQTYIQMLKIVQTLMPEESGERTELCEDFFRKTCESSLLTNAVIRVVENILPESSLKRLEACRTTEVGGDCSSSGGRLTVYCLPEEWSSKRRKGQNQRRGPKRLQRNSRR